MGGLVTVRVVAAVLVRGALDVHVPVRVVVDRLRRENDAPVSRAACAALLLLVVLLISGAVAVLRQTLDRYPIVARVCACCVPV